MQPVGHTVRPGAMLIGYLWNPPEGGPADAQRRALAEAGCEQVVEERPRAGGGGEQPELHDLLARLRAGDLLVVTHLDSLGRSLPRVAERIHQLAAAGVGLRSLAEPFDAPAPSRPADMATAHELGGGQGAGSCGRGAGGRPPKL